MPITDSVTAHARPVVGLLTGTIPVPLEGVSVHADVTGICARVVVSQRYRNREPHPIEAVYVFPLDENAAVCGFEAVVNGVRFVGEVKPRDEAFRIYDEALEQGHGAYLLDEERPDVFTASVGNVPPGGEVLLRLTYVTELGFEGDAVRFTLPTTVSPRYAPADDRLGVGRSAEQALNPPVAWSVPYGLDVTIVMDMPGRVTRVESPSHPIAVALDGWRATVSLANANAALDRDLVVLAAAEGLSAPHALLERGADGQHTAAIVFRPTFDTDQAAADVVFVVDRSGSMAGTSIAEVRNALQLCLRSLPAGSRFNIVGFGSTFVSLFPDSVAYDDSSLAKASAHVASLDAELGGTEILPALRFVLEQRRATEMPRQVVVLTDGEVTNTDAVIGLVRQHASDTRVFTFGIGRGASAHLVRGMARAGNGAAEFIYPGERAEAKVVRQFARLLTPALSDVTIEWGGLDVTRATTALAPVFAGERLVAYGWMKDAPAAVVRLSARGSRGRVSFDVALDPERATPGTTLATLAARARIRELEESPEGLALRGSRQAERKASRVRDDIVRLATTYGLVSRETSFVAVERRETPIEGEAVLRRIPVALTSGWGEMETARFSTQVDMAMPSVLYAALSSMPMGAAGQSHPDVDFAHFRGPETPPAETRSSLRSLRDSLFGARPARAASARSRREAATPAGRALDQIVALQRADGSWDLTADLAAVLDVDLTALEQGVRVAGSTPDARRLWATALALAWLDRHACDTRDEWRLLADKAERWLVDRAGDASTVADWLRAAAQALA